MSEDNKLQTKIQREITDLTSSIGGLIDSFRELRNPLVESHEQVPQATDQLDKITEQTEAAAQHMLDKIESITQRDDDVIKTLVKIKKIAETNKTTKIVDLVASSITDVETNLNDAYAIMDALQFQDITSQQMNHAAAILEEIEIRLDKILGVVGYIPAPKKEKTPKIKKERAFDPNADMNLKQTEQSDIDSLFAAKSEK